MTLSFERVLAELGETFSQPPLEPAAGTDSGVANAYVYTHSGPLVATLSTGTLIRFTPTHANTGPSTINVNATGVVNIVGAAGAALAGGELTTLGPVQLQYNGTAWQILSTTGATVVSGLAAAGADSGAANAYVYTHNAFSLAATLTAGTLIRFIPANTNTGASTLNADGTGAVAVTRANGSALTGGELSSLGPVVLQSTGTQWQIVSTAGAQPGKERTPQEVSAGIIPVNYSIPSHATIGSIIVDRYGNNTTPGTTDMSAALQSAVNLMLLIVGSSQLSCPVIFLGNAYSIVTPPTFGSYTANWLGIEIAGQGVGTQIINNAPIGQFGAPYAGVYGALFDMSARSGWRIRDLLICGNSAHKNDGIYAGLNLGNISTLTVTAGGSGYVNGTYTAVPLTGGTGTLALATIVVSGGAVMSATIVIPQGGQNYLITDTGLSASNANLGGSGSGFTASVASVTGLSNLWRIERVTSFAVGTSLKIRNTSSYKIDRFSTWPTGLDPTLLKVPQTVTLTDVNHGIYITGSFAQLGYITDSYCLPRSSFATNNRGLKTDATNISTLTVLNSDFESGNGVQLTGIDCANITSANFINVFNESSAALFTNCADCNFQIYNGGIGGGITFQTNCVNNSLLGTVQTGASGSLTFDVSSIANQMVGCTFNSVTDNAVPPNNYIGSAAPTRGLGLSAANDGSVAIAAPSSTKTALVVAANAANAAAAGTQRALSLRGGPGAFTLEVLGSATSGSSFGPLIAAGTTSADIAMLLRNQAQTAAFLEIFGDGHGTLGPSATTGLSWDSTGKVTASGAVGINNNSPPAQLTGWGTPVGNAVIASYNITDAGGANSNTNKAVAQIIATLKAFGLFGA